MPDFEIICLANSRKRSSRCIAGIRTDGQGWLRPVGWTTDGGLTSNNYWLDDNSEPQVLDVIRLNCARPHPKPYHSEDWILGPSAWHLVNRPAAANQLDLLRNLLLSGPALFGDTHNKIPAAQFNKNSPAASSLALIEPENLQWLVEGSRDKRRLLAQFSLRGAFYSLPLTDPLYERKMSQLPGGIHPRGAAGIAEGATVWLTISLGEPFQKETSAEPCCYKLAAAVIVLPGSELREAASIAPKAEIEISPFFIPRTNASPKSKAKAAQQTIYERNYERWSEAEDGRLIVMAKNGMTAEAIANLLQRSESAVVGRVGKLVLEKYRNLL